MDFPVDVYFTLALAAALLVLGGRISGRVPFLSKYCIPDAVVGGLLAAVVLTSARGLGNVRVQFDTALQTPLNILFFTTVGLSADLRSVAKGGRVLALYFVSVFGALLLQNVLGSALAALFGLHPVTGLIAGSITLVGGHGTGAAWGAKFASDYRLQGMVELAVACATFGLVAGGVLGGPFARWMMSRHGLQGSALQQEDSSVAVPVVKPELPLRTITETLLLMVASLAIGLALHRRFGQGSFTLPPFMWALAVGVVLRNVLSFSGLYRVDDRAVDLLGSLALSLFLSMVIMTLKLWELVGLALPILVILTVQTAAMLAYSAFWTYRLMGRNYDAVLLATGQIGFGLGSTATAIVSMQNVAARFGHSPLAFLLVPVMGAFLIDLANAVAIQGFLMLPGFRR